MSEALQGWTIDKRVPLAIVFAFLAQFAGLVAWGSSVQATLNEHSAKLNDMAVIERERQRDERALIREMAEIHAQVSAVRMDTQRTREMIEAMHGAIRGHLAPNRGDP
jgi:hypothetical protein